jgi:uncharacterized protein
MSADTPTLSHTLPFEPTVCIYHHPCPDGATAAALIVERFPRCELIFGTYGKPIEPAQVSGQSVLLVDFAAPPSDLATLNAVAKEWYMIDHHESSLYAKADKRCFIEIGTCGAVLCWKHLNPGREDIPIRLQLIDDYDCWKKQLPDAFPYVTSITSYNFDHPPKWFDRMANITINDHLNDGAAILRSADQRAALLLRNIKQVQFAGFRDIPIINLGPDYSVMGLVSERISKQHPFIVFWFQDGDGEYRYSLRSDRTSRDYVPSSLVAVCFGGGGHSGAAGFRSKLGPTAKVMQSGPIKGGEFLIAAEIWADLGERLADDKAIQEEIARIRVLA